MTRLIGLLLLLALVPMGAWAQWSEPTIGPIMMTAPLDPPPVTGTTFYVDKNSLGGTCNNTNPGTQTQPWCSIGKAASTLTAGQRAYVRAATYTEGDIHPTNSGTPGNYMTFQAFPGESPAINCAGFTFCWDGVGFGWSYVVWNGFEAFGPNQQIYVQNNVNNHHIWFINGKYHDTGANFTGFHMFYHNNVISNNEVYNSGTLALLFYGTTAHDNIIEFNQVHDNGRNGDDGGALSCGGDAYTCVVRYNTVWNNYRNLGSTNPCFGDQFVTCTGMTGIYFDFMQDDLQGTMSYVYNNLSFDNDQGIQMNRAPSFAVFNNLVFHNGYTVGQGTWTRPDYGRGINVNSTDAGARALVNAQIYNNTVVGNYGNGLWIYQNISGGSTTGLHTRNNIFQNNAAKPPPDDEEVMIQNAISPTGNLDLNYDLIVSAATPFIRLQGTGYASLAAIKARGGNTTWVNSVDSAASFVNAGAGNYHLTAASAGVNQGTTVGLFNYALENIARPQAAAWDIGAYEGSSGSPPSAPTNLRVVSP